MPSGTPAARQTVEVGRQGEYTIAIGNSLKRSHNNDGSLFTSVKYNFKPTAALQNPVPPRLTKHAPTGEAPYTLTLTPPATPANSSPPSITYTGSQNVPPPRKTECILLFDPATQSFTLEKLSSTFTFNANVYALAHPPLPLRPPIPDGEDDDASAGEKEDDNPFDYRHFINKKSTTKTRAEQKAEREERRKEALKRAGKGAPEDDEPEEEDEDELPGLGITYDRPKIGGKGFLASPAIGPKKIGGKSPFGGKKPVAMSPGVPLPSPAHVHRTADSSDEDESDEADDEDEVSDEEAAAPPPPPPPRPVARKPPVSRNTAAARRKVQQEEPEEFVFPEPSQPLHVEDHSEEDISDSESDEDAPPPPHPNSASVPVQEEEDEEEDDGFDLAELLEKELENGGDLDMDAEGEVYDEGDADGDVDVEADGVIIFEDDEVAPPRGPPKAVGLGIGAAGVPISFGQMMGGRVEDESESESEEE